MRSSYLIAAIALCGCITLSEKMNPFVGKPVNQLTARLGPPQSERRIAGELWYTWNQDQFTTGMGNQPIHAQCAVSVRVNPANDVVLGYRWEGNLVGCGPIERSLRR